MIMIYLSERNIANRFKQDRYNTKQNLTSIQWVFSMPSLLKTQCVLFMACKIARSSYQQDEFNPRMQRYAIPREYEIFAVIYYRVNNPCARHDVLHLFQTCFQITFEYFYA